MNPIKYSPAHAFCAEIIQTNLLNECHSTMNALLFILIATQFLLGNGLLNGELSNTETFPFFVFLQDSDHRNCGGSLIANRYLCKASRFFLVQQNLFFIPITFFLSKKSFASTLLLFPLTTFQNFSGIKSFLMVHENQMDYNCCPLSMEER